MTVLVDWIIAVLIIGGFGLLAAKYYRGQTAKYRAGGHNKDMDKFRGGGGGCCR